MPCRFWKRGGGFKEDDAVWAEPQMPRGDQLPEAKALNPDHCFVAALGISGEQGLNLMNVNCQPPTQIWIIDSNPSKIFNSKLVVQIWAGSRWFSNTAQIH